MRLRRIGVLVAAAVTVLGLTGWSLGAKAGWSSGSKVRVYPVATFDLGRNEAPEGITIDHRGVIYVSMALTGEIRRIDPNDHQSTVATVDVGEGLVLGLETHHDGILAAVASFDPDTHGVWLVTRNGDARRIAALDPTGQPNGITMDHRGNIYVGDSLLGLVWRITPAGIVERWAEHPLLVGDFDGGIPDVSFGANGVLVHDHSLYVANTDSASIVKIPIRPDGSAGTPQLYVQHPALLGADDLAVDVYGNLYVTTDGLGNSLVRVTPSRKVHVLADADDGLDYAAGLAFGRGLLAKDTLFIANVGLNFGRPAVRAAHIGIPGVPGS